MAKSAQKKPAANRTTSEIDYVLRRAKWRRGAEMMRDPARAQSEGEKKPAPRKRRRPAARRRAKARKR